MAPKTNAKAEAGRAKKNEVKEAKNDKLQQVKAKAEDEDWNKGAKGELMCLLSVHLLLCVVECSHS